ncbi:ty1-copia retrotransposon protein [Cucumis melo var. makuwa]|uniref:Ty1-copia retrotransposon protein n=1 Tax=Cucumis melo var. makuwa TaxID=1194695 RepID=A0A5D3E4D0_CUCMM|nr:ty1-copia retrotransposon protein [Cucumis melo var. makuwa]TYK30927.1 ty1-copia retrotransposon protein [Cucumis melo var. makuwa]
MTTRILQMKNVYSWETQLLQENLVSGSLLNWEGFKIVLEDDKVVLTKNGEFVNKGYLSNGLFVLNIVSMNANVSSFAYIVESVDLWHGRLEHLNFASIRKLKDLRLIHASESHEIDNDEINSTSGYVFLLGGGAISWKSTKQTCIARSIMEYEFIALELAGREVKWIESLLGDVHYGRHKHGAVKQLLKEGAISLEFVRSEKNLTDPLTKGLTRKVVLDSSVNMGLKPFDDP